ncbi:GNAT family N-acetyltransferase [Jeotgalibacillus sp. S-D1]|uniref:GNAT family N-acetyltransferase n=1 Tax=Jeotgalibacillus sp. S-D1 TaxID=2552189 RepID=UPI001059C7FD|nr:GNAT family N-acetyltransferase [Jeotgalibacillus sp. S-D1]TDL31385.1 GNAT family N-acetyltransferase [Jeotgalibacillus sp. S-D1]
MYQVRKLELHEHPFLLEMLYESIHIPENKPEINELLNSNGLKKYSENWGRPGDNALAAVDEEGHMLGAVWYRLFSQDEPGYGFVDQHTPELGMAIRESERGKGVGSLLMSEIIRLAKEQQYDALSLSVDPENTYAVRLYKKFGFVKTGVSGTSDTMVCNVHEVYELVKKN